MHFFDMLFQNVTFPPLFNAASVLEGVCLLVGHRLLVLKVQMGAAAINGLQLPKAFHHEIAVLILGAVLLLIQMM